MKALVIYDSYFNNTEKIAQAIGEGLQSGGEVKVIRVNDAKPDELRDYDVLVVGSPTRQFSPTGAITTLLKAIPSNGLAGIRVAAFDTRFPFDMIETNRFLEFMVRIFGYAAEPIAKRLVKKKGELAIPAEGFYVGDTEGPLLEDELARAVEWGKQIVGP